MAAHNFISGLILLESRDIGADLAPKSSFKNSNPYTPHPIELEHSRSR